MPTGENFKGKDVKFNVNLPKDLLGPQAKAPAAKKPVQASKPTRRAPKQV